MENGHLSGPDPQLFEAEEDEDPYLFLTIGEGCFKRESGSSEFVLAQHVCSFSSGPALLGRLGDFDPSFLKQSLLENSKRNINRMS